MRYRFSAVALATAVGMLSSLGHATAADLPSYDPSYADIAHTLPVRVAFLEDLIQPQISYQPRAMPQITGAPYPGMSLGQSIGIDLVGNLLASAIVNGPAMAEAKADARQSWRLLQANGCNVGTRQSHGSAIEAALEGSPSAISRPITMHTPDDGDIDDAMDKSSPRQMIRISVSLTSDLRQLVSVATIEGYVPSSTGKRAARKPAWRNKIIVVSSPMDPPDKTSEHAPILLDILDKAFEASGSQGRIRRTNVTGTPRATDDLANSRLTDRYFRDVRDAAGMDWTPQTTVVMRAHQWTTDQCLALTNSATENARILGEMIEALYEGTLPPLEAELPVPSPYAVLDIQDVQVGKPVSAHSERIVRAYADGLHASFPADAPVALNRNVRVIDAD